MNNRLLRSRSLQQGTSLIELMVGMIVALVISLAAAAGATAFTKAQKQAVGASTASTAAAITLAALKEDVSTAGLGLFSDGDYLCSSLVLALAAPARAEKIEDLLPVRIKSTEQGRLDSLEMVTATEVAGSAKTRLDQVLQGDEAKLVSFVPANPKNAPHILLSQQRGNECALREVTARQGLVMTLAPPPAPAELPVYDKDDGVSAMGRLVWRRYRVEGDKLMLDHMLDRQGKPVVLLRNVVEFRVQYGLSTNPESAAIAEWRNGQDWQPKSPKDMVKQLRAVRVGITTRSSEAERRDENGRCESVVPERLFDDVQPRLLMLQDDGLCYRYRSAVVTIPLRNVAWGGAKI